MSLATRALAPIGTIHVGLYPVKSVAVSLGQAHSGSDAPHVRLAERPEQGQGHLLGKTVPSEL
eukprot:12272102-Alexandrium_andersonii.AAC.1